MRDGRGRQPAVLSLDFGGTKLTAALFDAAAGAIVDRQTRPTPGTAADSHATMIELGRHLVNEHSVGLAGVGVSFGGPVDAPRGSVRLSRHVPGWEGWRLSDSLGDAFGVEVRVDNDANVAALGEWRFGAGRRAPSVLYVTVSTGVGAGLVLDGRVFAGRDGMAGEIGHVLLDPSGPACACGQRGCVEAFASGPSIARIAGERLASSPGEGTALRAMCDGDTERLTARDVASAAQAGDRLSADVLAVAADALGRGIAVACLVINPDRVVVGGGVVGAGEAYLARLRAGAQAGVVPDLTVDIVTAELGADAPLWGGLALLR